ncbi:MAG: hypothetical protein JSU61_06735 [Fidelibacterota bacterium]|nr:MAG: hypothetical protein JSU61_06735 [Candidatus Neomarinimicrobiota bacterium]
MTVEAGGTEARLVRLEARLHAFRAEVLKWQLDHIRYHKTREYHWGLVALMEAHPFRTLAAGLAAGALLAAGLGGERFWRLLEGWLR